jgi:mannosyltransferase OCH1-like enzyme
MIPKALHFVWVGDESLRPDKCIETWEKLNPSYTIKVWGNKELEQGWHNAHHMKDMWDRELNGVADMMRYEILYAHGGITLDADSVCVRPLEDWLLEPKEFACWENEHARPGLVAAGYLGSEPQSPFFGQIVNDIHNEPTVTDKMAWETVGPLRVTQTWKKYNYPITIYPSHYFIPEHFTGAKYTGSGHVFAEQLWGSTKNSYGNL